MSWVWLNVGAVDAIPKGNYTSALICLLFGTFFSVAAVFGRVKP